MVNEEKLLRMAVIVNGDPGGCEYKVEYDEYDEYRPVGIGLYKAGNLCWTQSISELIFQYVTRDMEL